MSVMAFEADAQKQLVFLSHGNVIARYTEGSYFSCQLKNRQRKEGFIVKLDEFSMITSNDTIPFLSIGKVNRKGFNKRSLRNGIGGLLFVGGIGFIVVDQINAALGYSPTGWDQSDRTALIIAGIGAVMVYLKPQFLRVSPGIIIRTIDYKSPYYLPVQ